MSLQNITLLSLAEILGDFELEAYAHGKGSDHLYAGLIGYAGVVYMLVKSMQPKNNGSRGSDILKVNLLWDGVSALVESLAAYYLLGETFKDDKQYLGAVLIIVGLVLVKFDQ